MAELKILVEFIVAVVSAYFLMKIESVKQQKDIAQLQLRVGKLEEKTELHEKDVRKDLQEIKEMIHSLQLKLVQQDRRQIDK
jgi:mannitol-specific phosphotransferase system IIBC component